MANISLECGAVLEKNIKSTSTSIENPQNIKENNNEFAYLQRNEFTSEIYKIEVRNLGYFGIGELKRLLKSKLQLDITKIKSPLRKEFAFVCFRSQIDQEKAIQILDGYKWKGKSLKAFAAKASADPLQLKRRKSRQLKDGACENKKQRTAAEATCPLSNIPYTEQLLQKEAALRDLFQTYLSELKKTNRETEKNVKNFTFKGVLPSPQIEGYRNKNEFTVGRNSSGEVVVGFRLGCYSDGSTEVSDVEDLPHISLDAKWAARTFQNFARKSRFEPFNPEFNSGHFRQITVRTSTHTKEIMIVVGIYSSNLIEDDLNELKCSLKVFYENVKKESNEYQCTSLYYQDFKHREPGQSVLPIEHIAGTTHITDSICGLEFRISPLAFFQINTKAATVLYEKAIDLIQPQPHTTVLDICCGTGTIALSFAKHCKQVLGVEIVSDAIKDAEYNAAVNKIENCKFYAGNADIYIQSMVKEILYNTAPDESLDLVVVVDPPRAGLHNRSIAAIRAATTINRLVYISCCPQKAQRNWIELGRAISKQYKGNPFYPKTAYAIDMFPHTPHTEAIILFERQKDDAVNEDGNVVI